MLDALNAPAAPPATVRREDYRPPAWLVPEIELDFDLGAERTRVTARLRVERNGAHDEPLRLDGEDLVPISVTVDDQPAEHRLEDGCLVIPLDAGATVETIVEIASAIDPTS